MVTAFHPAYCGANHPYAGIAAFFLKRVKVVADCYEGYLDYLLTKFTQKTLDRYLDTEVNIASNVHLHYRSIDRSIRIRLYSTHILIYYPDNTFCAGDGGFHTPTTKSRMCQFGPTKYNFYYKDYVLHGVHWPTGIGGPMNWETRYPVFPSLPIKRFGRRTRRVRALA